MFFSSIKNIRLFTLLYIGFVFFLTLIGRDFTNYLRDIKLLVPLILCCFIVAAILSLQYIQRYFKKPNLLSILLLILLAGISAITILKLPYPVEKIHFLEFGLLALLIRKCLGQKRSILMQYLIAFCLTGLIGYIDEVIQLYLPRRYFDWRDVGLNFSSAGLGLLGYELIHNHLKVFRS